MLENRIHRGYIMPIGGNEDKTASLRVLEKFVELAGGKDAIISIIPTASVLEDLGDMYAGIFTKLGAKKTYVKQIYSRADANNPEVAQHIEESTGIFMTGGNQMLLSTTLGGTTTAKAIRKRNAAGVIVAGTSAGAAFIPEHMIAQGESGAVPIVGSVIIAPGLGLTNKVMIDQHFSQRNRLGRLLTALSYNPFKTGVGVDEDTAALIDPSGVIEAVGSGALTIIDMSELEYSSVATASIGDSISLVGVRYHTLMNGDKYDMSTHKVTIKNKRAPCKE